MLTPQQRSQYEGQGYLHLPNAFDREAVEAVEAVETVTNRVWEYLESERDVLGKNIYTDSAVVNYA